MSKIAFDIAIIPPDNIQDICVDLCKNYPDNSGRSSLDKIDNLPHISLFMGACEEKNLVTLFQKTQNLIGNTDKIQLTVDKLTEIDKTHFFAIEKIKQLQSLHEAIVNELKDEYCQKTSADMYYDKNVDKKTFFWNDNYVTGSSFENFWPHITLKACGNPIYNDLPIKFIANRIAICHLGGHCTCRKILWETKLKSI